jgi:hypothetical protein
MSRTFRRPEGRLRGVCESGPARWTGGVRGGRRFPPACHLLAAFVGKTSSQPVLDAPSDLRTHLPLPKIQEGKHTVVVIYRSQIQITSYCLASRTISGRREGTRGRKRASGLASLFGSIAPCSLCSQALPTPTFKVGRLSELRLRYRNKSDNDKIRTCALKEDQLSSQGDSRLTR